MAMLEGEAGGRGELGGGENERPPGPRPLATPPRHWPGTARGCGVLAHRQGTGMGNMIAGVMQPRAVLGAAYRLSRSINTPVREREVSDHNIQATRLPHE